LLEELQRRYPGQWDGSVLRTLQRRVRLWRAKFGAEREVYFAQEHLPGRSLTGCTNLHWPIRGRLVTVIESG
jgi:hypothetical protein